MTWVFIALALLTVSACDTEAMRPEPTFVTSVRRSCRTTNAERAKFVLECIRSWNPGEEDWGKYIGDDCDELAWRHHPPPVHCSSWFVEVKEMSSWHPCDLQTDPVILERCTAAGWKAP